MIVTKTAIRMVWAQPFNRTARAVERLETHDRYIRTRSALEGEPLDMDTRLVVAPAAGTFEPDATMTGQVTAGQIIGHIVSAADRIAVRSPFDGLVASMLAWPNERVRKYQMVLALDPAPRPAA